MCVRTCFHSFIWFQSKAEDVICLSEHFSSILFLHNNKFKGRHVGLIILSCVCFILLEDSESYVLFLGIAPEEESRSILPFSCPDGSISWRQIRAFLSILRALMKLLGCRIVRGRLEKRECVFMKERENLCLFVLMYICLGRFKEQTHYKVQ